MTSFKINDTFQIFPDTLIMLQSLFNHWIPDKSDHYLNTVNIKIS